jgi:hypothetical protein
MNFSRHSRAFAPFAESFDVHRAAHVNGGEVASILFYHAIR